MSNTTDGNSLCRLVSDCAICGTVRRPALPTALELGVAGPAREDSSGLPDHLITVQFGSVHKVTRRLPCERTKRRSHERSKDTSPIGHLAGKVYDCAREADARDEMKVSGMSLRK